MAKLGDARDMLKAHAIKTGPFRVASDLCKFTFDELAAAAATLRDCHARTPLSVATGAARKALGSLAKWTDHPGFGASLAKLGHPDLPDSEYRELAKEVGGLLDPAGVANDARNAAIEEGRALATAAAEQVREALSHAALACSSRGTGGVHALEEGSLEMVEVADALEVLTKTSNWRLAADDRWTLAENKEVCDAAAESLARAVVPTLFVPLLGARDIRTTREVNDAAERVSRVWSGGEAVWRAVGDAVDKFGVAPDDATVVAAAVIAHLPFTSERPMRDRVEDEVSGHLEGEVERGTASAPNARSLVESLTHALVKRVSNHVKAAAAALRVRDDADAESAFLWILAWLERDTPGLAMEAVNEVADDIRLRFSEAAEKAGDVGFRKLKLLANPILHSLDTPATFRHRAFKGATDALKDLTMDVHVALSAVDSLELLLRIGRPPTPSPSPTSSLSLPPSPPRLVRQRKVSKEREHVPKPIKTLNAPKPSKKKATTHLKSRANSAMIDRGGLAMLSSIAASQEDGGDAISRDWSSFYVGGDADRAADDASKLILSEQSDEAEVTPRADKRRRPAQSDRSNTKSKTNDATTAHKFAGVLHKRAKVAKTVNLNELGTRLAPAPPMFTARPSAAAVAAAAPNLPTPLLSMPMCAALWLLELCRKMGTGLPEGADQRFLLEFSSCPASVLEVLGRINWPGLLRMVDNSMHGMLSGVINTTPSAVRGVNFPWVSTFGAAAPPAALNPGGRGAAGAIEGATGASEGSGGRGFGGVSGATDGRGGSSVSVPVEQGAGVARGFNLQFLSGEKKKSGKRKLQEDSPKSPDPYAFDDSADAKPTVIR